MSSAARRRGMQLTIVLGITVAVTSLVWAIRMRGMLQSLELKAYDVLLQRQARDMRAADLVTVIGVTENDIQRLRQYPITDTKLVELLKVLQQQGACAIGIDIFRDFPNPPADTGSAGPPEGWRRLNEILAADKRIVAIMRFGTSGWAVPPPPVLMKDGAPRLGRAGFCDHVVDPDGLVRRMLLEVE